MRLRRPTSGVKASKDILKISLYTIVSSLGVSRFSNTCVYFGFSDTVTVKWWVVIVINSSIEALYQSDNIISYSMVSWSTRV